MFRVRISYSVSGDKIIARLSSANFSKSAIVGSKYYAGDRGRQWGQFVYCLRLKCKELCRDELFMKYGSLWRKHEQPKQMIRSANSAIKRMKEVKQ